MAAISEKRLSLRLSSLLLIAGLIASSLVFTSCGIIGEDQRITAVAQALADYQDAHPELKHFDVADIAALFADTEADAGTKVQVPVRILDLRHNNVEQLLPSGTPLEFETDITKVTDSTYQNLRNEAREKVIQLATALPSVLTQETTFPVSLNQDTEGAWEATIDVDQPKIPISESLVTDLMTRSSTWLQLAAQTTVLDWKPKLFPGAGTAFENNVRIDSITPDAPDQAKVSFSYPDLVASYEQAAQQAYDTYNSQKGPIFGSITEDEFEHKMTSEQGTVSADQKGSATLNIRPRGNVALPAEKIPAEELPIQILHNYEISIMSNDAVLEKSPEQAKKDAMKPRLDKLNKEKVVKAQKRPGTERLVAGGSGVSVTIKTGNNGDKHVTFFKWGTKTQVVSGFVKSGKSLKLKVPVGSYRLVYSSGETWYGQKHSFGPSGNYREFKTDSTATGPMKVDLKKNYSYTITVEGAVTDGGNGVPSGSTDNPYA